MYLHCLQWKHNWQIPKEIFSQCKKFSASGNVKVWIDNVLFCFLAFLNWMISRMTKGPIIISCYLFVCLFVLYLLNWTRRRRGGGWGRGQRSWWWPSWGRRSLPASERKKNSVLQMLQMLLILLMPSQTFFPGVFAHHKISHYSNSQKSTLSMLVAKKHLVIRLKLRHIARGGCKVAPPR